MESKPIFTPEDVEKNKAIAALANVPFLFWLPWVAAKDSALAKFYLNQGFWLLVVSVAAQIVANFGLIGAIIGWVLQVLVLVFMIIGICGACKGVAKEVPGLGKIIIFK